MQRAQPAKDAQPGSPRPLTLPPAMLHTLPAESALATRLLSPRPSPRPNASQVWGVHAALDPGAQQSGHA